MDKMTGRPRGFAFVTMGTPEEAKIAAEKINGVEFDGRPLTVNEARPKEEGSGRSFGGAAAAAANVVAAVVAAAAVSPANVVTEYALN